MACILCQHFCKTRIPPWNLPLELFAVIAPDNFRIEASGHMDAVNRFNLTTAVKSVGVAARGCCSGTLHCSASDQNGEILNVCNRFCFEPVGHSDAFRLPLLGSSIVRAQCLSRPEVFLPLGRWHDLRIGLPRCTVGKMILYRYESVLGWLASREEAPRMANRRTSAHESRTRSA